MTSGRPFAYAGSRLQCDGVDVAEMAAQYGTPLYVYSAQQISARECLHSFHEIDVLAVFSKLDQCVFHQTNHHHHEQVAGLPS